MTLLHYLSEIHQQLDWKEAAERPRHTHNSTPDRVATFHSCLGDLDELEGASLRYLRKEHAHFLQLQIMESNHPVKLK